MGKAVKDKVMVAKARVEQAANRLDGSANHTLAAPLAAPINLFDDFM